MQEITVGVDGMMCGMCESHVNDAVRAAFPTVKTRGFSYIIMMSDITYFKGMRLEDTDEKR